MAARDMAQPRRSQVQAALTIGKRADHARAPSNCLSRGSQSGW
jgi:hypothetical protein